MEKIYNKNLIRIIIIAIISAIIRYIFIVKIGLDIKETYDFFYLFISTGILVGIINFIYEDIYMLFSSGDELVPIISGNIGIVGIGIGNSGVSQSNPVNPVVGQSNLDQWGNPN